MSCVFKDDVLPFELMGDGLNINHFFDDDEHKLPTYKLESAVHRLKVKRLPKYVNRNLSIYSPEMGHYP